MSNENLSFPVFPVQQPIGTFFVGVVDAKELLKICEFDFRRISEDGNEFIGIQRKINERRVKDIGKYITTSDAVFPTSIVISLDNRCSSVLDGNIIISSFDDGVESIPFNKIAKIIDGQHRLKAFVESEYTGKFDISVSIFVGADEATQASIFSIVNMAQTKVNRSLVYDLFSLENRRSPQKTCHEICIALDSYDKSPFYKRIKRLGVATEGRFDETLSQATVVSELITFITSDPMMDRDIGRTSDTFPDREDSDNHPFYIFFKNKKDEVILKNLLNFFSAVQDRWPISWKSEGGSVLCRTNGYIALMRVLKRIYIKENGWKESNGVISVEKYKSILDTSRVADGSFTTDKYLPGSSGSSRIYKDIMGIIE